MSLGILATLSVGIVDAYFLGQLGSAPLAAVGYIYPVTVALTSLSIGLSAGANAVVSQAIGANTRETRLHQIALHANMIGLVLAVCVASTFALLAPVLFPVMGASDRVMTEILAYSGLWAVSFPFLVIQMITGAIFRARGDAVAASALMIGAALINIALTPVLIFGWGPFPQMGTAGAAMATLASRIIGCGAAVGYGVSSGYLRRCARLYSGFRESAVSIASVGAPSAFSNAINPAGMALVTAAVGALGDAAVAGFGAAARIQSVALVALLALSAGIGPVVGQNWGANKKDRARQAVLQSWAFCMGYGLTVGAILFLLSGTLADIIAPDDAAGDYTRLYLQIVGWSLFGYGILVVTNAAMNARSKALYSMGLSITRVFVVYVPLAWGGVFLFGYTGILGAAVVANLFAVGGAVWCSHRTGLASPSRYPILAQRTS
ncbi:MAG: MATE family efflux transporter [Pseudomonadota bacterium]